MKCSSIVILWLAAASFAAAKPDFQYQSGDILVSIPSADEPKVKAFGQDSVRAASKYLEDGALSWVREKSCINCHTTGPYLSERPALTPFLGAPTAEVLAQFVKSVPANPTPQNETEKDGLRYYSGSWTSIWRSVGLAEWDKHVKGALSEHTDRSLRDMFERQSPSGAFVSYGEVEIPHITTDFELTLQAARAVSAAPGWLDQLSDETIKERVGKMKTWLRTAPPKNDFDRVLRLQLAFYFPETVSADEKSTAISLLTNKQHADGGWSTRDMSALADWHFRISEKVNTLINGMPDAAKPESDAYMTALAVVLFRQSGTPTSDPRVQRGIEWLRKEQRETGRWWMHSLYRGNYHYITYIASTQALKALALCDALPVLTQP
jgi:squalene-hopene/tetraprenyl-beta-curcumene cyclase